MGQKLPPKKDVLVALLEESSVFIHLDPRSDDVGVPSWFKKQPELVLQIGLNMPVPIRDLEVDDEAVSCTLSFSRTPHFCYLPWQAIYALVSEDGRGMVWPEDIPPEVAAQKQAKQDKEKKEGKAAAAERKLRAVPGGAADEKKAKPKKKKRRAAADAPRLSGKKRDAEPRRKAPAPPEATPDTPSQTDDTGEEAKPARRKSLPPYLRVVK